MGTPTVSEATMERLGQSPGEIYFPIGSFSEALFRQRISHLFSGGEFSERVALGVIERVAICLRSFEEGAMEDLGFSFELRRPRKAWKIAKKSCGEAGHLTGENTESTRAAFEIYYGWLRAELQRGTHETTAVTLPWNAVASWADLLLMEVRATVRN